MAKEGPCTKTDCIRYREVEWISDPNEFDVWKGLRWFDETIGEGGEFLPKAYYAQCGMCSEFKGFDFYEKN